MRNLFIFFLLTVITLSGCHSPPKKVSEGALDTSSKEVSTTPAPIPDELVYEIKPGDKAPSPESTPAGARQRKWEWQITPEEEGEEVAEEEAKDIPTKFVFPKKFDKPQRTTLPPLEGEKIDVDLTFHAADIREVIRLAFEDLLKLNYVIDRKVAGVITLRAKGSFYREELKDIIQLVLNVNGFAMIVKDNIAEITTIQEARQRTTEVYVGGDIQRRGEDVITQLVPLEHIVPQGIIPTLRGFMSRAGFVVAPNDAHALVISEQASNMDRVLSIVKMFDVPVFAGRALKFYDIRHVDVKALAKELEDVARSLGAVTKGSRAVISFTPFAESNRLFVASKSPELLSSIDFWIQNADIESEERTTKLYIYKLQHQKAKDVQPILTELYSDKISGQQTSAKAPGAAPGGDKKRGARVEKTKAGAVITEQPMRILADEGTNSLIIKAVPTDYQEIRSIIDALDASPQQVLIEVVIAEVKLTKNMEKGAELFLKNKVKTETSSSNGSSTTEMIGGKKVTVSNPISTGTLAIDIFFGDVQAIFKMLATESTLNFLSTPHVLVRDDQQASIQVGEDIPISKGQTIPGGSDVAVQDIEYQKTGIIFTVTPHIAENGMVTLDITEEVSEIGEFIETGGQKNPKITIRKAETSLVIQGGKTVMLGGIIQDEERNTVSKVPFLGDVPVLGYLFKSLRKENEKTELLVLITPHVINTATEAEVLTGEFEERVMSLQRIIEGTTIGKKDNIIYEEG